MANDIPTDFFVLLESLPAASRREIEADSTILSFEPPQMIYEQGTPATAVFFIISGVVEAVTFSADGKQSRLVAAMSAGDFFGDLAVLTGQPRVAAIRTRENAEVLRIDKDKFIRLLRKIPELGLFFSNSLAARLYRTSTEAHHVVYSIDLNGNLQKFDLLTIVQAITSMGHTGELHLNNSANELLGNFFFRKGRVEHARFGHLLGLEAIWQGFIESASEGTFSFRSVAEPALPYPGKDKIDMDSTNLLLEGVGKRDTYQGMPEALRMMDGHLARITKTLEWKVPESKELAEMIWELIGEKPQRLVKLWRQLNFSAISFLEVVMELGMTGQAELFVDAAKEED